MNQPRRNRDSIPAGIITFLFTDVEGSSRLWEADAVATAQSVEVHDALIRRIIDTSGGHIFGWAGDHFRAAFQDAQAAVDAAVSIQNELARTDWRSGPSLRVRMGLHRGNATLRGHDYFGTVPNRTGRLEACAAGGQILISSDVAEVVELELLSLGHHRLRDVPQPMLIYQIGCKDFPSINLSDSSQTTFSNTNSPTVGLVRELGQVLTTELRRMLLACCDSVINAVSCNTMDSADIVLLDRPGAFYLWTVMSATTEELVWDRVAIDGLIDQADKILAGSTSDPSLSLRRAHDGLDRLAADLKSRLDQIDLLWADIERINELSGHISDWQVSDSAAQLDFLVRNRRERISAFMGGDEAATQMIVELIDGGLDFANAIGIAEQRLFNLRVAEVLASNGGSLASAEEYVHHLDYQLAVLSANGFVGEDAVVGVALAMSLDIDIVEVVTVVAERDVDLVDAIAWIASSRALGVSVSELLALRGFRENLSELDNPSGGKTDDKVSIGDLRYVGEHPWKFADPTVVAAQALLDNPDLWNRLDTAARNEDLLAGEVFGSRNPGDGVVSLDDLEMFMIKSQIHSVLKEYRSQIDIAADASAEVDGFYSRADFRRFIEENPHLPDEVLVAADAALEAGWFDRTWFEDHRDELALGAAVLAGGAVIVLSAGTATPLVLAAGAAAGATAAGGTALTINLTGDAHDAFDGVIKNIRNGAVVGFTVAGLPTAIQSIGATTGVARLEAVSVAATDVAAIAACGALDIVVPEEWEDDVHATAGLAVSASAAWSVGGDVTNTDPAAQSYDSLEGGLDAAANLIGCEAPDDVEETPEWARKAESYLRSSTDARSVFDSVRAGTDMDASVE